MSSIVQYYRSRLTEASRTALHTNANALRISAIQANAALRSALTRVFLLGGGALFIMLFWRSGLDSIRFLILKIGWAFPFLFLPHVLVTIFEASGWWFAFPPNACRISKMEILRFSVAAKAIQHITPSISQGGELLKFHLLRLGGTSADTSMASVLAAKTTITLGELLFIGVGFAIVLHYIELGWLTAISVTLGVLVMCLTVIGLLAWQRGGFFRLLVLAGRRFNVLTKFFNRHENFLSSTDSMLREYIGEGRRFWLSTLVYFFAWLAGALEASVFLKLIGLPADLISAVIVQTWLVIVNRLTAFVPGNLGTHEAGAVMIFSFLGFSAEAAMGFALLRRVRQMFWIALGLGILAKTPRTKDLWLFNDSSEA
jgi:uncharacterized protein (TIRG00374 family)